MDKLGILQLAELVGATHKTNLGVYQFYPDELVKFVEMVLEQSKPLPFEHSDRYYYFDRNK
jgi:hypothetical protein